MQRVASTSTTASIRVGQHPPVASSSRSPCAAPNSYLGAPSAFAPRSAARHVPRHRFNLSQRPAPPPEAHLIAARITARLFLCSPRRASTVKQPADRADSRRVPPASPTCPLACRGPLPRAPRRAPRRVQHRGRSGETRRQGPAAFRTVEASPRLASVRSENFWSASARGHWQPSSAVARPLHQRHYLRTRAAGFIPPAPSRSRSGSAPAARRNHLLQRRSGSAPLHLLRRLHLQRVMVDRPTHTFHSDRRPHLRQVQAVRASSRT